MACAAVGYNAVIILPVRIAAGASTTGGAIFGTPIVAIPYYPIRRVIVATRARHSERHVVETTGMRGHVERQSKLVAFGEGGRVHAENQEH